MQNPEGLPPGCLPEVAQADDDRPLLGPATSGAVAGDANAGASSSPIQKERSPPGKKKSSLSSMLASATGSFKRASSFRGAGSLSRSDSAMSKMKPEDPRDDVRPGSRASENPIPQKKKKTKFESPDSNAENLDIPKKGAKNVVYDKARSKSSDPSKSQVYRGVMSKKRSKAVEVRGLQVILKEKDEKKEKEKDELMERMQRRMGMGGLAQTPRRDTEQSVLGNQMLDMERKRNSNEQDFAPRDESMLDPGAAARIAAAATFKVQMAGLPEIQEQHQDEEAAVTTSFTARKSIFEVDPTHPMAVVLRSVNTNTLWGKLRYLCILLVSSPDFELIVIILIFANCCSLAMLKPTLGKDDPWNMGLDTVELVLNACFTFELVVRTIAVGGFLTFLSYPWNFFDAAMVSIGYTQFLPTSGSGADSFRSLRAIRALRPLRTITRFDSLRSVVVCFMEAIPLLASVASMLMFFLFLFGVCGVQLFGNVYHKACFDTETGYQESGGAIEDSVGCGARQCPVDTEYNYQCMEVLQGTQINVAGYDNVGTSLLTAFHITTLSNWNYVMYRTMDSAGGVALLFYLCIVVLGTYFIMILFLAVLKLKFSKAQEMYAAASANTTTAPNRENTLVKSYKAFKTSMSVMKQRYLPAASPRSEASESMEEEDEDVYVAKVIKKNKTVWGYPKYLLRLVQEQTRKIIMHKHFNNFFLFCILINTVLLAIEFNGMPPAMSSALSDINFILTQIFTLEVVLKLFGLGIGKFFKDGFNIFDLMVVILSQVEIILNIVFSSQGGSLSALRSLKTLRVLKSFRVLRVFKMFRYLESLRKIGEVLFNSMSSFISIGALTLLFNVVFSIMGLHVYGEYHPDIGYPNFNTFINSCTLIFQVLTLEDWDLIAFSYVRETDYSTLAFFVAWIIVGKYIFLTLFLAVTLEAFESKYDSETVEDVIEVMADEGDVMINNTDIFQVDASHSSYEISASGADSVFDEEQTLPPYALDLKRIPSPNEEQKKQSIDLWRQSMESHQDGTVQVWRRDTDEVPNDAVQVWRRTMDEAQDGVQVWRRSLDGSGTDSDGGDMSIMPVRRETANEYNLRNNLAPGTDLHDQAWGGGGTFADGGEIESAPWDEANAVHSFVHPGTTHDEISSANVWGMVPFEGGGRDEIMAVPLLGPDPDRPSAPATGHRRSDGGPVAEAWTVQEQGSEPESSPRTSTGEPKTFMQRIASKVSFKETGYADDGTSGESPTGSTMWEKVKIQVKGRKMLSRLRSRKMDRKASTSRSSRGFFRIFSKGNLEQELASAMKNQVEKEMKEARHMFGDEEDDVLETGSANGKSEYPPLAGYSLWIFSPDQPLRVFLYNTVTNKTFDYIMFAFIILSCAAMVYEHPFIVTGTVEYWVMYWLEVVFTIVFGIEALFKIVAFGFRPYSKSMTNLVDLSIVVSSVLLLALESIADNLQAVKGLRVLRAAKPLRTLTRSQGMMLVFKSLSMSVMSMANVTIICLLFFAIFGILGTQLFGGDFYHCTQPYNIDGKMIDTVDDCVGLGLDGEPLEWVNPYLNFDHLGNSLMTLFTTATLDGYADVMKLAMSVRGTGFQPLPGANSGAFLFFVFFIMIVAFCLLNLYVGVVFYQFSRIRMLSQAGAAFLTSDQREWMELMRLVLKLKPLDKVVVPKGRVRRHFYHMVVDNRFDVLMMTIIVANTVFMALEHYNMSLEFIDAIKKANYFFTTVFTLEAVFKITGLGWQVYIRSMWNKFDFFIVVASLLDIALSFFESSFSQFVVIFRVQKMLRLLRISRMIKLVKSLKGVQSLFKTLIVSLPAFSSVGALLMLVFFIYAYVGVLLFGTVRINEGMNHHANFTRFWSALIVLLRIATNDDWYLVMADCTATPPACSYELGDCGSPIAQWYFSSFVALASIIMLNLFTAVIIENFEKTQEHDSWKIVPGALEEFRELWSEYDDGTETITPHDLYDILTRLSPPLGLGPTTTNVELVRFVAMLDIPLNEHGRVPFHRTLYELVRRVSETSLPEGNMKNSLDEMVSNAFSSMQADDELMSFNIAIIVMRVQRKWRAVVRSKKVKKRLQQRVDRAKGVSSMEALLAKKAEIMADVSLARMEGKPWMFDDSLGLGALVSWAIRSKSRFSTASISPEPVEQTSTSLGLAGGLRRMTQAFTRRSTRSSATPEPRFSFRSSATPEPLGTGLANMVKRVTRLGTQSLRLSSLKGKDGRLTAGAQSALDSLRRNTEGHDQAGALTLEEMATQALEMTDSSDSDTDSLNGGDQGDAVHPAATDLES